MVLVLLGFGFLLCFIVLFIYFGPGCEVNTGRRDITYSAEELQLAKEYREETSFVSCLRDNCQFVKIFWRKYFPTRDPRAVVLLSHGLNDHSGRAISYIRSLLKNGFAVYIMDHEGFGRSDGRHGYFGDFSHLVSDFQRFIQVAKKDFPDKKIFLHGGSMGGLLIMHALLRNNEKISGAIIQCPAISIHNSTRPSVFIENLAFFLCRFFPKLPFSTANRGKNNSPIVSLQIQAEKEADPLFYSGKLRIGTGLSILKAIEDIQPMLDGFEVPYLLQHGTSDLVCHINGSKHFHQVNKSKDKTFREYPGGHHDLLREPKEISEPVEKDYIEWLLARS